MRCSDAARRLIRTSRWGFHPLVCWGSSPIRASSSSWRTCSSVGRHLATKTHEQSSPVEGGLLSTTPSSGPIDAEEFDGLMRRVGVEPLDESADRAERVLCVAVSGGADSMALVWLVQQWAAAQGMPTTTTTTTTTPKKKKKSKKQAKSKPTTKAKTTPPSNGLSVAAIIVDHHLRSESEEEANTVQRRLEDMGVDKVVVSDVRWGEDGPPRPSKLQTAARTERYSLLLQACDELGSRELFVAQHLNDHVETFLHRFARASGLDGLSSILPSSGRDGQFQVLRPLLSVPKHRLLDTCTDAGVEWVDDPSNSDMAYDRVRIREAVRRMEAAEVDDEARRLTVSRLGDVVEFFAFTRAQMNTVVAALLRRSVTVHPNAGYALCRPTQLCDPAVPPEISVRALTRIISVFGGRSHPPGLAVIQSLYESIVNDGVEVTHSCCGALVTRAPTRKTFVGKGGTVFKYSKRLPNDTPRLLVVREPPIDRRFLHSRVPIEIGETVLWDNRFQITVGVSEDGAETTPPPTSDLYICRLGKFPMQYLLTLHEDLQYLWPLKHQIRYGLPVIVHCPPEVSFSHPHREKLAHAIANAVVAIPTIQHSFVPGLTADATWTPITELFPDTSPVLAHSSFEE